MSDNRFSDCETVNDVLWRYHECARDGETEYGAPALARIAELTPPKDENLRDHAEHILRVHGLLNPTPRTVDAAGRERVREIVSGWVDGMQCHAVTDRIIDALGWTAAEPETCGNCDGVKCMACRSREHHDDCVHDCPVCCTTPSTPVVDLTPNELRSAAVIVEAFRELHAQTCKLNDDAIDAVPSTWPLPIIDAQLPVAVVCGEADWVLRIGGGDE